MLAPDGFPIDKHQTYYEGEVQTLRNFSSIRGSPGLVVMGGDSCCQGHGFKSWRHKLDGHFFILICCKNYIV